MRNYKTICHSALVLDLKNLIYIDSSGADTLLDLAHACAKAHVRLIVCGLAHQPMDIARRCGTVHLVGESQLFPDLASGLNAAAPEPGAIRRQPAKIAASATQGFSP